MMTWKGFLLARTLACTALSLSLCTTSAASQQTTGPPPTQIHNSIQNIQILFTEEEQKWLAENHTVRVRIGKAPPFSFYEEEPLGISGDYLNAIARRAGFQVNYIPYIPWPDALRHVGNREKIDLLPALTKTASRKKHIAFTQSYFTSPRVIFTTQESEFVHSMEDLANKTVSVEHGYVLQQKLSDEYPNIKLLIKESTEDALSSLSSGEADAYIGNLAAGTYVIRLKGFTNIKVAAPAPFGSLELVMGVRSDWPELAGIINKALATFSQKEHIAIRDKWLTPIRYEHGVSTADIAKWILGVSSFSLAIIITILIWNKKLTREITVRRQAEHDLKETQTQLLHAQKMEALGTLAGGIAHDFNNVLSVISANAELLLDNASERTKKRINGILIASDRAAELVRQILTFSRTGAGYLEPLNLADSIQESSDMIRSLIPTSIEIRQDVIVDCPNIMGDKSQILQIIVNLCINAHHAMEKAGGLLKISLARASNSVVLSITDTGTGIAPEDQQKIFDPFFTTKDVGKGTGLGLAVVYSIVKNHQGEISAKSVLNAGTTFTITFPITSEAIREKYKPEKNIKGTGRILIVEDEPDLCASYQEYLESAGYETATRADGLTALSLFREQPDRFDLVLTDQAMPNMTGEELAKQLLAIRPYLPIILLTGYSETLTHAQALDSGIRQYLLKPVKFGLLTKTIANLLD